MLCTVKRVKKSLLRWSLWLGLWTATTVQKTTQKQKKKKLRGRWRWGRGRAKSRSTPYGAALPGGTGSAWRTSTSSQPGFQCSRRSSTPWSHTRTSGENLSCCICCNAIWSDTSTDLTLRRIWRCDGSDTITDLQLKVTSYLKIFIHALTFFLVLV